MYIENINPIIFELGPLAVRWYGLMFAVSVLIGFYYMRKNGADKGFDEDFIFSLFIFLLLAIIIGARAVYVATNWAYFVERPELIIRTDRGGLAFHGGLIGGIIVSWLYCRFKNKNWRALADLAVPGIAAGIILVRIANIFNQEILGREATLFAFDRHPAQVYGSLIGLLLILLHNYLARRKDLKPGFLFWSFVLGYSLLRGFFEEIFRDNPLAAWGYINEAWGAGFFTTVQLFTPFIIILSLYMLWKIRKS
ncbi:MAG: prolipoprotein diacylglyceryl transferase [Dethiobacteria bacterium]|nr:prolipoprotein diacylglyceryl transferase [Dethiobacteria bacterium]